MIKTNISIFLSFLIFSGCSLKPTLEPIDEKVIAPEWKIKTQNENINDLNQIKLSYEDFILDETLKKVVETAIKNNKDLKIAISNIELARSTYRVSKSDNLPNINANGSASHSKTINASSNSSISHNYNANVSASYEIDFFEKIKNLNESALNSYLATKHGATNTKIALISDTITLYLMLASHIEQQKLTNETLKNLEKVYELTQKKYQAGVISKSDVYDANASLKQAQIDFISYSKMIEEDKNALELLIGTSLNQELLPKDFKSYEQSLKVINAGISSKVLFLRPDIIEAEYKLKAKNANIGIARAAFFPNISLTANSGIASKSLSSLFDGGAKKVWSFSPNISLPIFDADENSANLDFAKTQKDIALLEYEKSIQTAFKEVNDALITRTTINEQIKLQKELVEDLSKSYEISLNSYKIGIGSYLNVLVNQRTLINAKQNLIKTYLEDFTNRVVLYKSLGGNEIIEEKNIK